MSATVRYNPARSRWTVYVSRNGRRKSITCASEAEAKVRPLRFHDARHTFASWALESGKSIRWVQERLGHSSAELTLRTYSHLMDRGEDEMGWLEDSDGRLKGVNQDRV